MIGLRNVWICACDRRCQTQGRPKRTSKEVKLGGYEKGKINKEDALVCSKWRVLIRGTVTVGYTDDSGGLLYSFFTVTGSHAGKRPYNDCCCFISSVFPFDSPLCLRAASQEFVIGKHSCNIVSAD